MKTLLIVSALCLTAWAQNVEDNTSFTDNQALERGQEFQSEGDMQFQDQGFERDQLDMQEQEDSFNQDLQADEDYLNEAELDAERQRMQDDSFSGDEQMNDPFLSTPESSGSEF